MIIKYDIVRSRDMQDLIYQVQNMLNLGWKPYGNLLVESPEETVNKVRIYYQPIIKES